MMDRAAHGMAIVAILVAVSGCAPQGGERDKTDLNALSAFYLDYTRGNHKPPANEQVLREFIESIPVERRKRLHAEDIDSIFVSPRDGKPYVVVYGETSQGEIPDVFAYEQDGVEGKRWVARSLGYVSELDDAEFQVLACNEP